MRLVTDPQEMRLVNMAVRRRGERVVLVPTMGFLHEGHLTLIREGRRLADSLIVSIFVNPTQFGPGEDYERYPRDLSRDLSLLESIPVDVVFAPDASSMYAHDAQTWVDVGGLTQVLCGAHRPGHFRGVATVVCKLFNIVQPDIAVFGEKDYQQLQVIRRMVTDLNFGVEIVSVPIVREADGLAMSSRNAYLSPKARAQATMISRALAAAREAWLDGRGNGPIELIGIVSQMLEGKDLIDVEYVEAVDADTLGPVVDGRPFLLAVAARVDGTRLIDNIVLGSRGGAQSIAAS
jgi:pantoate--beta-alanine ligase